MSRTLIVAHRSLTPEGIENARSSILRASAAGADLIEIDIRLALDRTPVVIHDAMLGRTTRGRGWVRLWPSWLLRRLPLRQAEDGECIPTLCEMVGQAPDGVQLALHLKDRGALRAVIRIVRRAGVAGRTWLWLEHADDVHTATRALPELRVTLLRSDGWKPTERKRYMRDAQWYGASGVSLPWDRIDGDLITLAHQHHLRVFSVLETFDRLPVLVGLGLDGVITKDPGAVKAALDLADPAFNPT